MTAPLETSSYRTLPLGSDPALRRRYMVVDEDIPGNCRFGLLLEELDIMAEQTALAYVRRTHPEGRVVSWISSIARHRSIDLFRQSHSQHENMQVTWDEAEVFDLPDGQNVEHEVDLAQRQQRIRRAMAQLPAEQKQALGMAFFQGLSHPEIASTLGEPLGTVKTRIRLGMQKLRVLLQDEYVS